ncbi:MAG: hypothetical protein AAFQ43_05070 [Bacteroidota bacterium]
MRTALVVRALTLSACSASSPMPLAPEAPALTQADLVGTVWVDTCGDTVYWARFNEDQSVDYSTSGPGDWQNDGTDTWSLSGSMLSLSWSNGFRVATFDLSGGTDGRIDGTSEGQGQCNGLVHIERQS